MLTKIRSYFNRFAQSNVISAEELEGALRLPVLAVIPHLERRQKTSPLHQHQRRQINLDGRWFSRLLIHFAPDVPAAAAYGTLVKELHEGALHERRKVLMVTSPIAGEGATLTVVNLAIAGQRRGMRVLVVEGDMRRARISTVLKLTADPGLSGILSKGAPLHAAIQHCPLTQVDILPAGHTVPYPGRLWKQPSFERLLVQLRAMYDLILFEVGPLLLYPDSAGVAARADGTILVHQFGRGSAERTERAVRKLGSAKDSVLGLVMNDVPDGWS